MKIPARDLQIGEKFRTFTGGPVYTTTDYPTPVQQNRVLQVESVTFGYDGNTGTECDFAVIHFFPLNQIVITLD